MNHHMASPPWEYLKRTFAYITLDSTDIGSRIRNGLLHCIKFL